MKAQQYQKILQDLCREIGEGVHIVDADGITILYNEAMATLEKTRREEVLGKPFREIFASIPEEESTLFRALKYGTETRNYAQSYRNKYGKEISTINSTFPVYDHEGNLLAAMELSKDVTDIRALSNTILELQSESRVHPPLAESRIKRYLFGDIVGKNLKFLEVLQRARQAATSTASVFICGETGTGKELFAQSIHFASDRKARPFLAQNCAALPESLLEGILFGTVKGGFTGAIDREGLFEQANGGTLLLDELSAMPYDLQSKLLRVLQEDYIRRIGGTRDIPVDVRIIATVNEDPFVLIQKGKLRKDLYYRLKIIEIAIPALRERPDDILVLAESFIEKYNKKYAKQIWMLSERAKEKLLSYDYPGNTRELENIIMSAMALAKEEHVLEAVSLDIPREDEEFPDSSSLGFHLPENKKLDEYTGEIERYIILQTLAKCGGNVSRTADRLGIQRQTLQYKLRKYK